ncbi:MAG: type II toxin-antitoxin system VapC family toxin [Anaerolineae bacterium]|nr:type II toxin-antitoxin system VapC family toxin [Anaerolineae bacterium]
MARPTELFVDTAGWANILDDRQPYHIPAPAFYRDARQQGRTLVTTNYVMAELVSVLISPVRTPRPILIRLVSSLRASSHIEVVQVDPALDEQTWQLLVRRPDKDYSLVDCASFVIMQQRGLTDALTTDHHFEQASFTRLLR